jgi:hypothetical protein
MKFHSGQNYDRRKLNVWPQFKMATQKSSNTKMVGNFLSFLTVICMPDTINSLKVIAFQNWSGC